MYCQNCGKMQENGSAVCADCGAELIGKNDYGHYNKTAIDCYFAGFGGSCHKSAA